MKTWISLILLASALFGCSGPTSPPPTSIKPLDQAKVTAAKLNLANDAEIAPCNLQLKAENDLLVMNGSVPSEAAKKRAEELVRKVEGISNVANHLQVQPGSAPSPTPIL
jgi:hypothetical protein